MPKKGFSVLLPSGNSPSLVLNLLNVLLSKGFNKANRWNGFECLRGLAHSSLCPFGKFSIHKFERLKCFGLCR